MNFVFQMAGLKDSVKPSHRLLLHVLLLYVNASRVLMCGNETFVCHDSDPDSVCTPPLKLCTSGGGGGHLR